MRWPLLCLLLSASGCIFRKDQCTDLLESIPLEKSQETALSSEDFHISEWIDKEWWHMFDDSQLTCLIEKGLANSPTLKKATYQVEIAYQLAQKERSILFPQLWGTAGTNWQVLSPTGFFRSYAPDIPGGLKVIDLNINFSWDLDLFGKNRKKYEAAMGKMRAEAADRAETELFLCISIAKAYFDLQQTYVQKDLLEKLVKIKQTTLTLITQRRQQGLDNEIVKLTAERDLLDTQKTLSQTKNLCEIGKHLVRMLIGEGPDSNTPIDPSSSLFQKPFPLPQNLTCNLAIRRPDLTAGLWQVEAAAKEVGVAKTEFLPAINLTGFGGLESIQFASLLSIQNRSASLDPIISLPFFTGGNLTANLRQKRAAFRETVFGFNELLLKAAQEVADELSSFRSISEQLTLENQSVDALEKRTSISIRQQEEGLVNALSVLDEQKELIGEKLLQVELAFSRNLSALRLIKSLGGGF